MVATAILKKIVVSQMPFDRFCQNLAQWCILSPYPLDRIKMAAVAIFRNWKLAV